MSSSVVFVQDVGIQYFIKNYENIVFSLNKVREAIEPFEMRGLAIPVSYSEWFEKLRVRIQRLESGLLKEENNEEEFSPQPEDAPFFSLNAIDQLQKDVDQLKQILLK